MDTIQSIPGKLLFLTYKLYKDKLISLKQRGVLKGKHIIIYRFDTQ